MYSVLTDTAQAGVRQIAGNPTYVTTEAPSPTPRVNSDHIYELNLLGLFFADALNMPGAPDCDELNEKFVDTGKLQELFDVNNPKLLYILWLR